MMKIAGSGSTSGSESGSISQRHGSADPDPHQNDMDPQHCQEPSRCQPQEEGGHHPMAERSHSDARRGALAHL